MSGVFAGETSSDAHPVSAVPVAAPLSQVPQRSHVSLGTVSSAERVCVDPGSAASAARAAEEEAHLREPMVHSTREKGFEVAKSMGSGLRKFSARELKSYLVR